MKKKHYARGMNQAEYMREYRKRRKDLLPLLMKVHSVEAKGLRPVMEAIMKRVERGTLGRRAATTIVLKVLENELFRIMRDSKSKEIVEKFDLPSPVLVATS